MERRNFIKNASSVILGTAIAPKFLTSAKGNGLPLIKKEVLPLLASDFSLTEFGGDQEENPCMVSNMKGDTWLFSLRRLAYPSEKELISCFHLGGKNGKSNLP